MSDIFREVQEDVRRERMAQLWKRYGNYLIALAVLVILGLGGFELWQTYQNKQRDKASVAFVAAQQIGNPTEAAKAFAALANTAPGGYGPLAKMEQANSLLTAGQTAQAVALYREIADHDSGGAIGAVARLRAGWALADTAPRAELQTLVQPLLDPGSVWKQMAQELMAYADYHAGNVDAAKATFAKLSADQQAPDSLRARTRAFQAFLAQGGARNFGTVPPPAPVSPPGTPPTAAFAGQP